ncbi:MAG: hypothetical protein WCW87_03490 [Candidatus Paceibacterota bacterium]
MNKKHMAIFYTIKALFISVVITVAVCVIGLYLYNFTSIKLLTAPPTVFATVSANIFSIIAGFSILIAFNRFQDLKNTINQELACMGDILDLTVYILDQDKIKEEIVENVKKYGISVANDEWLHMADKHSHENTSLCLGNIMNSINNLQDLDDKDLIIFRLLIERTTDLTTLRANRLKKVKEPFPQLLTMTLYAASINFLIAIFLLLIPNLFFQAVFLGNIAFITSLVIQLVKDIGNPYRPGVWSVSKDDYMNIKTSILTQRA